MFPRANAILLTVLLSGGVVMGQSVTDEKLKRTLERITRGDELEAAEAADQLVEELYAPLLRAIGSFEKRPDGTDRSVAEIIRLRQAVGRLNASLRLKLRRLDLPEEDRKLFDRFGKEYPELAINLFADSYTTRKAAIDAVPLDKNTGAGVMIALRVDDEDEEVADHAIDAAEKLADPVVARGLLRFLDEATKALKEEEYRRAVGPDVQAAVGGIMHRSIIAIGKIKPAGAAAVVTDAFRTMLERKLWNGSQRGDAARTLGLLGDETAAPALLEAMNQSEHAEFRASQGGTAINQTVGDAALLALIRLYGLKPDAFNFVTSEEWGTFAGFPDDKARQDAYRRFRVWYDQNGSKPREQREAAAPRPTGSD